MVREHRPFDRMFDNLEELADTISEVLECSVTIEDVHHRLIAYSSHRPDSDPARISTIIGRKVPEKIIQTLWPSGVFQQILSNDMPTRVAAIEEIGLGDRIVAVIRHDKDLLGYIWVMEGDKQFDDSSMQQLKEAAKAASAKLMQLRMSRLKEERAYQDYLWQLLTGHVKQDREFEAGRSKLKLDFPHKYGVSIIRFAVEITDKMYQQIRYIIETMMDQRVMMHTISQDKLILLEDRKPAGRAAPNTHLLDLFAEQLKQRFGLSPVAGASGLVCDHYSQIEQSYQEALTLLRLKELYPQELAHCRHYRELGFYRALPLLHKDRNEARYVNAYLERLEQYDRKNNSNLLYTLEIYLNHNGNMQATAESLHIHVNTLSYRLKRITEVGEMDLNDMDVKTTCYMDLKMKVMNDRSRLND